MVFVFALLAALSNGTSAVTQHIASTASKVPLSGWRLIVFLVRRPLWLLGAVLAAAGAGFAVMCVGIVYLTRKAPETMEAGTPGTQGSRIRSADLFSRPKEGE